MHPIDAACVHRTLRGAVYVHLKESYYLIRIQYCMVTYRQKGCELVNTFKESQFLDIFASMSGQRQYCKLRTVEIQYKLLVPIYVFPEMKLQGLVISKIEYNVLPPTYHIHSLTDT